MNQEYDRDIHSLRSENNNTAVPVHKISLYTMALWLFFMMALPNSSGYIRGGLLFFVIVCAFFQKKVFYFQKKWCIPLIAWELFFSSSTIIGLLNGYEFSFISFEIYIIRPIVYVIVCTIIKTRKDLFFLFRTLILIALFVFTYDILYMLGKLGVIPQLIHDSERNLTIISSEFLSIRVSNFPALIFLTPFIFTLFIYRNVYYSEYKHVITFLMICAIIILVLSGRRAYQVSSIFLLLLNIFHYIFKKGETKLIVQKLLKILFIIFIIIACELLLERILKFNLLNTVFLTIEDAFIQGNNMDNPRKMQSIYMLKQWIESPILGTGIQSYMREYIHWKYVALGVLQESKWSYEYFYLALLFQIGIVGIIFVWRYLFFILKRIYTYYTVISNTDFGIVLLSIFSGGVSFIIVGASNPLVTSSWFWFIMISVCMYSDSQLFSTKPNRERLLTISCR